MTRKRTIAFTLVELMIVITIIAILTGGVALYLFGRVGQARITKARADLVQLEEALAFYKLKAGKYPEALEALAQPLEGEEEALVKGGSIPKDPWGNDYVYRKLEKGFELKSLGGDGAEGGEGENADVTAREEKKE